MEHKLYDANLKMLDEGNGSFTAYASTFGNFDMVGERVEKGAFLPHLDNFLKDGFIALGHDWHALPIATPTKAYEDEHGLVIEAEFHSTDAAQQARTVVNERLARGKSVKTSIGFETLKAENSDEGRVLKDVRLFEVSLVTVPANPRAIVLGAKGQAVSALALETHSDAVVSAVEELKARFIANNEIRVKEGRVLSDRNRKRIATLLESLTSIQAELNDLLVSTEPRDPEESAKLFRLHMERQARLRALGVKTA
jgi:HK97 family phage prohead protease